MTDQTIKIDYIIYNVIKSRTPEHMGADGHPRTAEAMRQNNIALDLILQRPAGKKFYHAVRYGSGVFSRVIALG